jgi:hypothetical protein
MNLAALVALLLALLPQGIPFDNGNQGHSGGGASVTCGNNGTPSSSTGSGIAGYNFAIAECVPPSSGAAVSSCSVYFWTATSGGVWGCGIWDSNGAGGEPGTLLCQSSTTTLTATTGWYSFTGLTGCPTSTASHNWWVGGFTAADASSAEAFGGSGTNNVPNNQMYYQTAASPPTSFTSPAAFGQTGGGAYLMLN